MAKNFKLQRERVMQGLDDDDRARNRHQDRNDFVTQLISAQGDLVTTHWLHDHKGEWLGHKKK